MCKASEQPGRMVEALAERINRGPKPVVWLESWPPPTRWTPLDMEGFRWHMRLMCSSTPLTHTQRIEAAAAVKAHADQGHEVIGIEHRPDGSYRVRWEGDGGGPFGLLEREALTEAAMGRLLSSSVLANRLFHIQGDTTRAAWVEEGEFDEMMDAFAEYFREVGL